MTVTVEEIRRRLRDLPESYVSDEVIQEAIEDAEFIVYNERSSSTSDDIIQRATAILATYKAALAYASDTEREMGTLPPALTAWLALMKEEADAALKYVKRGVRDIPGVPVLTESTWDYRASDTSS